MIFQIVTEKKFNYMTKKIKKENKLEELERRIKFLEENSILKLSLIPVQVPPPDNSRFYLPYYPPSTTFVCPFCGKYNCHDIHVVS